MFCYFMRYGFRIVCTKWRMSPRCLFSIVLSRGQLNPRRLSLFCWFNGQTDEISLLESERNALRTSLNTLLNNDHISEESLTQSFGQFQDFSQRVNDIKNRYEALNHSIYFDNMDDTPLETKKVNFMHQAMSITQDLKKIQIFFNSISAAISALEAMSASSQTSETRMEPVGIHSN